MATPAPSVSTGQNGLMAAVWLALVAMFTALLVTAHQHPQGEAQEAGEPVLDWRLAPFSQTFAPGDRPAMREAIPAVFFEGDSAALTDAGSRWLRLFSEQSATLRPDTVLRLDILPPGGRAEVTAARVAAVVAALAASGADPARVEIGTYRAGEGAHFGLAAGGQGEDQ